MANWNPTHYGAFLESRTRPSRDLAQRIAIATPRKIVDLGCGPGNSTGVCAERWPNAQILGIDNSTEMIEAARAAYPDRSWVVGDIGAWALQPLEAGERFDLIFSSAALQWIHDHATVFPRLVEKLAPGGVLAIQMPAYDAIPNRIMREMAASDRWLRWFPDRRAEEWRSHPLEFYYAALAHSSKWLDLWATDYLQVMPDVAGIVEWYKSTGLRPYLDRITLDAEREQFLTEYGARLEPFYPKSEAGGVTFLFRRLFILAGV